MERESKTLEQLDRIATYVSLFALAIECVRIGVHVGRSEAQHDPTAKEATGTDATDAPGATGS